MMHLISSGICNLKHMKNLTQHVVGVICRKLISIQSSPSRNQGNVNNILHANYAKIFSFVHIATLYIIDE